MKSVEMDECGDGSESNGTSADVVIECLNVGKHYVVRRKVCPVLRGLTLEICRGTIFSLLGPSGCGKTTLLKCVVGRLLVDQGSLKVFGKQPQPGPVVGYMPQTISLLGELTVRETLWLFGRLAHMDRKRTLLRIDFMLGVLEMSSHVDMPFNKLSGGQQRRVAFAAALLNEAPLLILDEPTVGVDPILRQNIWTYLRSLVSRTNTTVIITTHYIEEARNSQMIGMLLEGQLLSVSTPDALLKKYNCLTIEEAFLKLSLNDHQSAVGVRSRSVKVSETCTRIKNRFSRSYAESFNVIRILELTRVNFLTYFRHPWVFICSLILPSIVLSMMPYTMRTQLQGLQLAVINHDHGSFGQQFTEAIDFDVLKQVSCASVEDGVEAIRNGSVCGVLWFKRNFSDFLKDRMAMPLSMSDQMIFDSTVYAAVDSDNPPYAAVVMRELNTAYANFARETALTFSINPNLGKLPIEYLNGTFAKDSNPKEYLSYFQPAFFLVLEYFLISGSILLMNVAMFDNGYYDRLYTVGVSSFELIMSQMAYQLVVVGPQLFFTFLVMFWLNGIVCRGSYWLVSLLAAINYMSGVFIGLFLSGLSNSLYMGIALTKAVATLMLLSQGIFWPLEGVHESIRGMLELGPFSYPGVAMRNIVNKGWGLSHPMVMTALGISIGWNITCLVGAWIAYWFRK